MNQDTPGLLDSWIIALAAERKSEATRDLYRDGVLAFFRYCERRDQPVELTRPLVNAWVAELQPGDPGAVRRRRCLVALG